MAENYISSSIKGIGCHALEFTKIINKMYGEKNQKKPQKNAFQILFGKEKQKKKQKKKTEQI